MNVRLIGSEVWDREKIGIVPDDLGFVLLAILPHARQQVSWILRGSDGREKQRED